MGLFGTSEVCLVLLAQLRHCDMSVLVLFAELTFTNKQKSDFWQSYEQERCEDSSGNFSKPCRCCDSSCWMMLCSSGENRKSILVSSLNISYYICSKYCLLFLLRHTKEIKDL